MLQVLLAIMANDIADANCLLLGTLAVILGSCLIPRMSIVFFASLKRNAYMNTIQALCVKIRFADARYKY